MSDIKIITSNIVQAANQKESSRIDLTPWDLRLLPIGHIQKGLLFPKPLQEKGTNKNTLIHHLKASLSKTLDYFPTLAGRLATLDHEEDDSISYFINCNNAGALFIHAATDSVSISDIIKPVYVPRIVHSFFPLKGVKNYEGSKPLLGIQVTDLADGIFIGCTINHSVADGSSFWHFFNLWSEISKGSTSIPLSKLPVVQRWFPNDIDHLPIHIPKSDLKQVYAEEFVLPPLQERVFHFTRENIAKLKAKANAEVGTNDISSLQALLSHIWRSVIRNRNINDDEQTSIFIPIGARQRLCLMTSSSPRFNMYGNDFGWGKPIAVRSGSANKCDGKITLFCGAEEGSIDIEACLSPQTLEAMGNDEEFMDFVAF
ncbi:Transferase [Corchorus olitorius]|uniref:Transferase n=1 Tax=Corchorus olitorius TaxID=93759 RepID=A0A1R3GJ82_9ROSI|nr:Transferase [Corchorus olitorius]